MIWNLPNILSLYRIAAVPLLLYFCIFGKVDLFTWFLLASLISDILDGLIARIFKMKTEIGAFLDSSADMATFAVTIIGILVFQKPFLHDHWAPIVAILGAYLLEVVVALFRYGKITSFHTLLNRINAYGQGIFIISLFLFGYRSWIFYPIIALSLIAYMEEIVMIAMLKEWQSNIHGLYVVLKKHRD
jgi:cardiolipin synthase (CMP-forming)